MSMNDHFKTNKNSDTQMNKWVWVHTIVQYMQTSTWMQEKWKSIALLSLTHPNTYTTSQALSSSDINHRDYAKTSRYMFITVQCRLEILWTLIWKHAACVCTSMTQCFAFSTGALESHTCLCCSYFLSPWYSLFPHSHCLICLKTCSSVWTRK